MKAIVQDAYGVVADGVLRLEEIRRPEIGDDKVLIKVLAGGVDRGTVHLMTGRPYAVRLAGYGLRRPKTRVPGLDAAGVVEAVGGGVTRFAPGDEVFGICKGAFAEYASADAGKLALKPERLTFEQAAAAPVSGLAALQAVRDKAEVEAGQRVLIIGASGGVGTFAVQIAKAFGAEVTGVCSPAKAEMVRAIGADRVIDYTREDVTAGGPRFEAVLDIGGNRKLSDLRRVLTRRGTLVIVGGETGGRWLGGSDRQLRSHLLSPFVSQRMGALVSKERGADLEVLRELLDSGKVTPVIDRTFPLDRAQDAIQYVDDGRAVGKVVITT